MDQDLTPFEAELRRYEAGQIDRHELATWVAWHEFAPWEIDPMEDVAMYPGRPPGTFSDVLVAFVAGGIGAGRSSS